MKAKFKSKRQTFAVRITVPIMVFLILHTFVVVGSVFFVGGAFVVMPLLIGLVSAVLFGVLLRMQISRILSFSLKRLISATDDPTKFKARDGDADSNEEIAMLYAHFSDVADSFNTLHMDISAMADDHLKGVRSTTIDEGKYKGATKEMVKRVNAMAGMYASNTAKTTAD